MKHLFKSLSVIALGLAALQAEAKFKVVTTFTVIQDIAQNVAGDAATVESITKPGAEIHEYEPTPKDIVKAQSADLIFMERIKFRAFGLSVSSKISKTNQLLW